MTGLVYSQQDIGVLLYVGIACLAVACVIVVAGAVVGWLMDRRTRRHQVDDELAALDHGEPSRDAVERAALDALARAEAQRDMDRFHVDASAAFLDQMTAGRPYLRAIRDAQVAVRTADEEWAEINANGWAER